MKYSPIILLAVLTLAAPGTAQELQDNMSFGGLAARARVLTSAEAEIPEVRRAYGLAFYQPGVPGSVKADVCLWKDEDSTYGDVSLLDGAGDLYVAELFSPTYLGRSWLDLRGPGSLRLTVSWENFSSAVVAGQWVLNNAEDSAYGSIKGQQLSFSNTCN